MAEEIKQKIELLLRLGKERTELDMWMHLLVIMNDAEQRDLLESLEKELQFIQAWRNAPEIRPAAV